MDRKIVVTKTWTKQNGTKVPLPLMDNDYLKNAYRRCVEVLYGNESISAIGSRGITKHDSPITKEKATEWKDIFEKEAKKRNIKLPKINKDTYAYDLGYRLHKRKQKQQANKKFDDKFK